MEKSGCDSSTQNSWLCTTWAAEVMTVNLQVRLLVRTLSVPVRGVSRFASVPARTHSGQGPVIPMIHLGV